jgi:hypothetical protein
VHRTLADEGRIYLTVPAHSWLWSHEDVIAGHSRRYTLARLCGLLEATGYTVEFSTYFFTLLLLPILLFRALPFRLGLGRAQATAESINADHVPNAVARLLLNLLSRSEPRRIGGRRCIPFGASCLLVARKRRGSA